MPGVAGQLVRVLAAPRLLPGGRYSVRIALHPASLGTVEATVTMQAEHLTVHLAPSSAAAANALKDAAPGLRAALSSTGQQASVVLSTGRHAGSPFAGQHHASEGQHQRGPLETHGRTPAAPGATELARATDGAVPRGPDTHLVDVRV